MGVLGGISPTVITAISLGMEGGVGANDARYSCPWWLLAMAAASALGAVAIGLLCPNSNRPYTAQTPHQHVRLRRQRAPQQQHHHHHDAQHAPADRVCSAHV